jgi:hypothetical protein
MAQNITARFKDARMRFNVSYSLGQGLGATDYCAPNWNFSLILNKLHTWFGRSLLRHWLLLKFGAQAPCQSLEGRIQSMALPSQQFRVEPR